MPQSEQQELGKLLIISDELALYSTPSFSRRKGALILGIFIVSSILLLSLSPIIGVTATIIGGLCLYPFLVKIRFSFQPKGISKTITFIDFEIENTFIKIEEISKAVPVKTKVNRRREYFSVEILHRIGALSVSELLDINECSKMADFINQLIENQLNLDS